MLFNTLAAAEPNPMPYRIGVMSINPAFGLAKRQAGYEPSQTECGSGDTCAEACGTGYVQCASNDGGMHCFNPDIKETCCPDGTGNSCSDGYYCTKDSTGNPWCCPNGMDLAACAAAYSITGSLQSETAAPTSSSAPTSAPSSVSVSLSSSPSYSASPSVSDQFTSTTVINTVTKCTLCQHSTVTPPVYNPTGNLSATATTSAELGQFTGGAVVQGIAMGLPALVVAAGAVFL